MAKTESAKEKVEATKPKPETEPETAERECFFITPIGDSNSDERRECDGLLKAALRPVLSDKGIQKVVASHEINVEGSITQQIIERLLSSDLVIANLTALNANVMYELAVRHCTYKPTICIAREGTKLPFDLLEDRVIFFRNDFHGLLHLKEQLESRIDGIDFDKKGDNPVLRAKVAISAPDPIAEVKPGELDVKAELLSIRDILRSMMSPKSNGSVDFIDGARASKDHPFQELLIFRSSTLESAERCMMMINMKPFVRTVGHTGDTVEVMIESDSLGGLSDSKRWVLGVARKFGLQFIEAI